MPFVNRENGKITGVFALQQYEGQEQVADDNADLLAYLNPPPSPLDQLEAIITQGQNAMAEAPLPDDLQKQIFDLEVFVQNYYRRGAIQLIKDTINGFVIPDDRQDVTQGQRAQVDTLKTQMLAVFNAA